MSDLVVNVRQVSSYPQLSAANGTENILVQQGGLGGPYASIASSLLLQTALGSGSLGIGLSVPPGAVGGQIFTNALIIPFGDTLGWNVYDANGQPTYWLSGVAAALQATNQGWFFQVAPYGSSGAPLGPNPWTTVMSMNLAGAMSLPHGTLTVARDPAAALEVATMGYVGNHTVASFNGRNGVVQLWAQDIYTALGYDSAIATQAWVTEQITQAFQSWLMTCPVVTRWNGRYGSVYLMLTDISTVFFQSGQQPITPTPPLTSNDYSIANTAWVTSYVTETIAGNQGLATQAWVQANTVASFNGRIGQVVLTTADGTAAGLAPIASPQFSGIPTGPTAAIGNATSQLATTAFVWNAVQESTTGVVSWNGRTGVVTLDATDINDAGGALLNSPALTGVPTAPTASTGTTTTQLATCAFVLNEVQAIGAGVTSFNTRSGNVVLELSDIEAAGGAPIASPAFSGNPTTPTPASPMAATTSIANTNWVVQYNALNTVASFNGRIGAVTLNANDLTAVGALVNPSVVLTGNPVAPTAAPTTNTTQIATCAFVQQALTNLQGITVSPTPPASPYMGQAWFNSTAGVQQLYVYTGSAFVPSTNLTGYLPLTGGTLSGVLNANGGINQPLATGTTGAGGSVGWNSTSTGGGTGWVYTASGVASLIQMQVGSGLLFYVAPAGTAGAAITYTPALNLTPTQANFSGNLNVAGSLTVPNLLQVTPATNNIIIGSNPGGVTVNINAPTTFASGQQATFLGNLVVGSPSMFSVNPVGNTTAQTLVVNSTATVNTQTVIGASGINWNGGGYIALQQSAGTFNVYANSALSGNFIVSSGQPSVSYNVSFMAVTASQTTVSAQLSNNAGPSISWSATPSDRRLKNNLVAAPGDALTAVNALTVYDCDYRNPSGDVSEHWDYTLVADEVQTALPFAFMAPLDSNGYASLHPLHLIATLWKAVQQLSAEMTALKGAPA